MDGKRMHTSGGIHFQHRRDVFATLACTGAVRCVFRATALPLYQYYTVTYKYIYILLFCLVLLDKHPVGHGSMIMIFLW